MSGWLVAMRDLKKKKKKKKRSQVKLYVLLLLLMSVGVIIELIFRQKVFSVFLKCSQKMTKSEIWVIIVCLFSAKISVNTSKSVNASIVEQATLNGNIILCQFYQKSRHLSDFRVTNR